MKQTVKTIIHVSSRLLLFGGVIFAAWSLQYPAPVPKPPSDYPRPVHNSPSQHEQQVTATKAAVAKVQTTIAPPAQSQALGQDAAAQTVHHEYTYRMFGSVNDPYAAADWALTKVNAPAAWDIATGNNQTIVADIDTGFALAHQDLSGQWYQNPGETGTTQLGDRCWTGTPQDKNTNGCDDDNNGYVDDWRGWNFVQTDNNPQAGRTNANGEGVAHGTATAGFIGATGNNGLGSTAINQHTKIMPLTVLNDDGIGYSSSIVAAIYYATDNGAQVINLSLGTYANDPALQTAITYALNHNVVVVAAAGNCGAGVSSDCPIAGGIAYPALYPSVIAVGASTAADKRASFSSYGAALDVSAPGNNLPVAPIWTPANQASAYASGLYGTSFASPQVASLVALIKSIRPSSSPGDIAALIDGTAAKPGSMSGLIYTPQLGHGIIDASRALEVTELLNTASGAPTLLQAGSYLSEHTAPPDTTLDSGCLAPSGSACTVQLTNDNGYSRYLPYSTVGAPGQTGWSWSSDILDSGLWHLRARSGDAVSQVPYLLFRK